MRTREAFKSIGADLQWGKQKVVILIGKEQKKIVASPEAFRWLEKLVQDALALGLPQVAQAGSVTDEPGRPVSPKRKTPSRGAESRRSIREHDQITDEFADGTFIIDGVGCYPGEDQGSA